MTDRDAARTALIEVIARQMTGDHSERVIRARVALDAIAVARQDVPCETCHGGRDSHYMVEGEIRLCCAACNGSGSVPGPLLIVEMMGWERVDRFGDIGAVAARSHAEVYRRTPEEEV